MVKQRKQHSKKRGGSKGFAKKRAGAIKINASTGYDTCREHLSPFDGVLALIKFLMLSYGTSRNYFERRVHGTAGNNGLYCIKRIGHPTNSDW